MKTSFRGLSILGHSSTLYNWLFRRGLDCESISDSLCKDALLARETFVTDPIYKYTCIEAKENWHENILFYLIC